MLTWANHYYLDFAMNWVGHLQLLGVTAYMVGALDNDFLKVGSPRVALSGALLQREWSSCGAQSSPESALNTSQQHSTLRHL